LFTFSFIHLFILNISGKYSNSKKYSTPESSTDVIEFGTGYSPGKRQEGFPGTLYNVNFSVHAGLEKMGFLEKKSF